MTVGCDIVEIERIASAARNERFLNRVFTQDELTYYLSKGSKAETLAGMFAAKEAVYKALDTRYRGFYFHMIEITHIDGKPFVKLSGALKGGAKSMSVSVSHCKTYAVASAVAEG